jgi:hypothetical protein
MPAWEEHDHTEQEQAMSQAKPGDTVKIHYTGALTAAPNSTVQKAGIRWK